MKKLWIILLLTANLFIFLIGCSNGNEDMNASDSQTEEATNQMSGTTPGPMPESTPGPMPEPTAEVGHVLISIDKKLAEMLEDPNSEIYKVNAMVAEKLNGFDKDAVNVKKFGAVGDGKTDDSAAIMKAISSCSGPVYLPAGEYLINTPISISKNNSGIFGEGTLLLEKDIDGIIANGKSDIFIQGIYVKKSWVDNSVKSAFNLLNCKNVIVDGCEASGFSARYGVYFLTCTDFIASNNYIHDFSSSKVGPLADGDQQDSFGVFVRAGCNNGKILYNKVRNLRTEEPNLSARYVQTDGICCNDSTNIWIEGNDISTVGEGVDTGASLNITIKNNKIFDTAGFGIKVIHGTKNSLVEGNYIEQGGIAGIVFASGTDTRITKDNVCSSNIIVNTGKDMLVPTFLSGKRAGILLEGNPGYANGGNELTNGCYNNLFKDNVIIDNQEKPTTLYGIFEREVAKDNIFKNNFVSSNIPTKWRLQSTDVQ
jgi:hypothetical protein